MAFNGTVQSCGACSGRLRLAVGAVLATGSPALYAGAWGQPWGAFNWGLLALPVPAGSTWSTLAGTVLVLLAALAALGRQSSLRGAVP